MGRNRGAGNVIWMHDDEDGPLTILDHDRLMPGDRFASVAGYLHVLSPDRRYEPSMSPMRTEPYGIRAASIRIVRTIFRRKLSGDLTSAQSRCHESCGKVTAEAFLFISPQQVVMARSFDGRVLSDVVVLRLRRILTDETRVVSATIHTSVSSLYCQLRNRLFSDDTERDRASAEAVRALARTQDWPPPMARA